MSAFRPAVLSDVDALLELLEPQQHTHEARHPVDAFEPKEVWRDEQRGKLVRCLERPGSIGLVRDAATGGGIDTCFLAPLYDAPPVYAPGGPVCFDEAFAVAPDLPDRDALCKKLLDTAEAAAWERGAVLLKLTCSHGDETWASLLTRRGFTIASEWYRGRTPTAPTEASADALSRVRPATAADVPRILELGEQKRLQYQEYQPVMWRKSDLPRETFTPRVTSQVEDPATVALVHEDAENGIDGYVIAQRGYIDDYMVTSPERWEAVGGALLVEASRRSQVLGEARLLVVCAHADGPKRSALAAHGLELCLDWYVHNLIEPLPFVARLPT
jgi:GNAT superfamily N-acetyltransferase